MQYTVTKRNRNWGFAWSNRPVQTGKGLVIEQPNEPEYRGLTFSQICHFLTETAKINSGNDYCIAVFYDGRRVVGIGVENHGWNVRGMVVDIQAQLDLFDSVDIITE